MHSPLKLSVIVPSWKRVDYLEHCFRGLASQRRQADEVILGLREGDTASFEWLKHQQLYSGTLKVATVSVPGVIAAMQAALDLAEGDIICNLDDDAEALPDWLERMEKTLLAHPELGGLGGRDLLTYLSESERDQNLQAQVGIVTWFGRQVGNHHCGKGPLRQVTTFKGCNAAFRGELLKRFGYDHHLRGTGAQLHWEVALSLDIQNAGYRSATTLRSR
jgi:glycosyltransferase involved in cell wall biosynthesis